MPRRASSPAPASTPRRLTGALAGLALVGALLAGCGSAGDTEDAAPAPVDLVEVRVGVLPIVDVAPLFLGRAKGFFANRGIDLKTELAQAGPQIVPGVVSGKYHIGFSNMTSLMINQATNKPIQVVASGVASTGRAGLDFGAIVVPVDSPIRTAADLSGKTILVNAVGSIGDTTIRESVRKGGGDPKSLTFVATPLPKMQAEMEAGRGDAAWVVEPWLALTKGAGGRAVAWNFVDMAQGLTVAAYFTSTKVAKEDPALVQRFVEAINESMRFANDHPDQIREILQSYMSIEQVLTAAMTLPFWPDEINREGAEKLARLGVQDGLFKGAKPDLAKLLPAA
jgi:NitT/TauT family transport system substrate-binding protein